MMALDVGPETVDLVEKRGQFAVRGGILDLNDQYRDLLSNDLGAMGGLLGPGRGLYAELGRQLADVAQEALDEHVGVAHHAERRGEILQLGPEVVGTDDLAEIFEAMRTDPKLHFETGEQLVEASEVAMARASIAPRSSVSGFTPGKSPLTL